MSRIILEVEDTKLDQLMSILGAIRSDIITKFEVSPIVEDNDLKNDPLAQELQRRIQEVDDGTVELIAHSEVMSRIYAKWEQKCM